MTRYALLAALLALLGLSGGLWWVMGQRDAARAESARLAQELATATRIIDQQREATEIHRIYLQRAEDALRQAQTEEADALTQEGANAPASDYLLRILDRVR